MTKTIGILIFDGAEELDFVGPWEVFTMAAQIRDDIKVVTIAERKDPVNAAKGMRILPDHDLTDAPKLDVLLVPVDGTFTMDHTSMITVIDDLRAKLVIPMHFRTLTYRPRNTMWIESFLNHFKDEDVDFAFGHTVDVSKEDIPERTRVLVMDYVR